MSNLGSLFWPFVRNKTRKALYEERLDLAFLDINDYISQTITTHEKIFTFCRDFSDYLKK